jgi:hypothetical protein
MDREAKLQKVMKCLNTVINEVAQFSTELNELPVFTRAIISPIVKKTINGLLLEECEEIYTDTDLDNLIAFYESKTGQKAIQLSLKIVSPEFKRKMAIRLTTKLEAAMSAIIKDGKSDG